MKTIRNFIILMIAQGAFAGRAPIAPGTVGTLVGVLLFLFVKDLPAAGYLAVCVAVILVGVWSAGRAEKLLGKKDHSSIVIDEIAGYLLSLFMLPPDWRYMAAGFFLFRFFDILKPYPLNTLQRVGGGLGVMLDDIGAGIYTNIALQAVVLFLK